MAIDIQQHVLLEMCHEWVTLTAIELSSMLPDYNTGPELTRIASRLRLRVCYDLCIQNSDSISVYVVIDRNSPRITERLFAIQVSSAVNLLYVVVAKQHSNTIYEYSVSEGIDNRILLRSADVTTNSEGLDRLYSSHSMLNRSQIYVEK